MFDKRRAHRVCAAICLLFVLASGAHGVEEAQAQGTPGLEGTLPVYRMPRIINRIEPEYTDQARENKLEGTVVLLLVVGVDGKAHDIRVKRSLGMGLDERAVEAVRQWQFKPATKDGQQVPLEVGLEVNFRLYPK